MEVEEVGYEEGEKGGRECEQSPGKRVTGGETVDEVHGWSRGANAVGRLEGVSCRRIM